MATRGQTDKAVTAVRNGVATKEQEKIARRASKVAGSYGTPAREAFKSK